VGSDVLGPPSDELAPLSPVRIEHLLSVTENAGPAGEPDARYYNYGCLAAHVEEAGLATRTTCERSPS